MKYHYSYVLHIYYLFTELFKLNESTGIHKSNNAPL